MHNQEDKMTRHLKHSLFVFVLLLLAACGGSDPEPGQNVEDGLAKFEEQEIGWEPCDPNLFGPEFYELLTPVRDRLECATLKTPLDWDNPGLDEVNLGVLRVRAGNKSGRAGAIFTNPGGPGADGLELGATFGLVFANGGSEEVGYPSAAPDLFMQISERYDVIGFSPRGLGGSFQLFCGTNQAPPKTNFYTDRSEANVQALLEISRLEAEACLNNPLGEYVSTEQTVQDMDLVRRLLGDEKLNFFGYSYGTWLGAWYAKRFPEQAGNIVLDANLDITASFQDATFELIRSSERGFREVALPYAARNNEVFGLGTDAEEIYALYDSFPRELKAALISGRASINGDLYSSALVADIAVDLVAARGVATVLATLSEGVTPENFDAFAEQLEARSYAENEGIDSAAREAALVIGEDYLAIALSEPENTELDPGSAVFDAVTCNDTPYNQNPDFWIQKGDEFNTRYPLLGGGVTANAACAFWPGPTTQMPEASSGVPPILMVQNGFDPSTPVEGALRAFESLPGAKLVYVENELSHTTFPYNTPCVDEKVAAYLLDGTLPAEEVSSCDAKALPGETQVYPPGGVPSFEQASALSVQAAETPGPNPLYDLVHKMVRENAAEFYGP